MLCIFFCIAAGGRVDPGGKGGRDRHVRCGSHEARDDRIRGDSQDHQRGHCHVSLSFVIDRRSFHRPSLNFFCHIVMVCVCRSCSSRAAPGSLCLGRLGYGCNVSRDGGVMCDHKYSAKKSRPFGVGPSERRNSLNNVPGLYRVPTLLYIGKRPYGIVHRDN